MMLLGFGAFAQQAQPAATTTDKDGLSPQMSALNLASELVRYGYQTQTAMPLIQAVQIYKRYPAKDEDKAKTSEGTPGTSTLAKGQGVSFDETQLLADATRFAEGNKNLLALIDDARKASRGPVQGAIVHRDRVIANTTDVYNVTFRGGESAIVMVIGDGDTDLDLYIYDENGNLIDSDLDMTDNCVCTFTPRWTGNFTIKIKNRGSVYNNYVMYCE